ncbi:MAG: hypothetical protein AB1571_01520 [Nanoarchaeota archaeon]
MIKVRAGSILRKKEEGKDINITLLKYSEKVVEILKNKKDISSLFKS